MTTTKEKIELSDTQAYTDSAYVRDTCQHIALVSLFMAQVKDELKVRAERHDESKLYEPERSIFRENTAKRDSVVYGSVEYYEHLRSVRVALNHHYANNRHHPEHHLSGIRGMNLVDLIEMLCDWMSASMKEANGDPARVRHVIHLNQERFGYSDEMAGILNNTVSHLLDGRGTESESGTL